MARYVLEPNGQARVESTSPDPAVRVWVEAELLRGLHDEARDRGIGMVELFEMLARGWSDGVTMTRLIEP